MITKEIISNTERSEWDFANEILYKMCLENFCHTHTDIIVGKVLLIGRTYAAAIERRKNKAELNDDFYLNHVSPQFKGSELDERLKILKKDQFLTGENIENALNTHYYLMKLIFKLTAQDKRSFVSKYLHFHIPNLFFIYDSRAVNAVSTEKIRLEPQHKTIINSSGIDKEYATFFIKSYILKNRLEREFDKPITIRHFDNILMKLKK